MMRSTVLGIKVILKPIVIMVTSSEQTVVPKVVLKNKKLLVVVVLRNERTRTSMIGKFR